MKETPKEKKIKKTLAAKILLGIFLISPHAVFGAGIPVYDAASHSQTTVSAMENISQSLKQLEQYATQLQQLEYQIRNTVTPSSFLWAETMDVIGKIQDMQHSLDNLYEGYGGVDEYARLFGTLGDYAEKTDKFLNSKGSTEAQREEALRDLQAGQEAGLNLSKTSNDTLMLTLEVERKNISQDASKIDEIQKQAETAEGQMEALQHMNQFQGQLNTQLLQMRAVQQATSQAVVAKLQIEQDREARKVVAGKALRQREGRLFEGAKPLPIPKFGQ